MGKFINIYKITAGVISIVCLYVSSAFIVIEFTLLVLYASIPFELIAKVGILSLILIIVSILVKKLFPNRFIHSAVYKFLSLFIAVSLSIFLIDILDLGAGALLQNAFNKLETDAGIQIIKVGSFTGVGIMLLILMPITLLMDMVRGRKKSFVLIANALYLALFAIIMYFSIKYFSNGWETIFVNGYVIPLVRLLIGSLSLGWAYELFFGSIGNEGNIDYHP